MQPRQLAIGSMEATLALESSFSSHATAFWASETFLKDIEGGNQKPIRMGYGRTVKVQPNPLRIVKNVFPLSSHC